MKEQFPEKERIKKGLLTLLRKAKYTVYTKVVHVSKSGMLRHLDTFIIIDNHPMSLNWHIEKLGLFKRGDVDANNADSLRVHGVGMDVGFEVVYNLGLELFGQGKDCTFKCRGIGCPSNDHVNDSVKWDRRKLKGKIHSSGGYALIQRWL